MRMNPARGLSAAALLSKLDDAGLAQILSDNADEPQAGELARQILHAHARSPLATTRALADVVHAALTQLPRHPDTTADATVRRVFQALRIAVNDEFGVLEALLRNLPFCLKPGGRAAILTFHSGEDRRVKLAFKNGLRDGPYVSIANEVIRATAAEQRANPRSSAAKLRFAVRGA
jgi:16S rRNA (cytosine1402-N4)-methyltransferase